MKLPIITLAFSALVWTFVETRAEQKPLSQSVSVRGHVVSPTTVDLTNGATKIDILDAVAKAGGFKGIADKKQVVLILNYGQTNEEVVVVNVKNRKHEEDKFHWYVRAGDVIHVPQRRID